MLGIDYCNIRINEQQMLEEQLRGFQLFQIVPVEETGIQMSELLAFAKNEIKNVDRMEEIVDILANAIKKRRPSLSKDEAINIVLDFDM